MCWGQEGCYCTDELQEQHCTFCFNRQSGWQFLITCNHPCSSTPNKFAFHSRSLQRFQGDQSDQFGRDGKTGLVAGRAGGCCLFVSTSWCTVFLNHRFENFLFCCDRSCGTILRGARKWNGCRRRKTERALHPRFVRNRWKQLLTMTKCAAASAFHLFFSPGRCGSACAFVCSTRSMRARVRYRQFGSWDWEKSSICIPVWSMYTAAGNFCSDSRLTWFRKCLQS